MRRAVSASPRVGAILLAAGRGTRFDAAANKLLADIDGKPLLRFAAEAALAARVVEICVVTGRDRTAVAAALAGLPLAFAHNPDFESGLASSLRVGVATLGVVDAALVLLGDMPGVTAAVIDALIDAYAANAGCSAVVPTFRERRGNPALIARALFPQIAALRGDVGARGLLKAIDGVVELPLDDESVVADVDHPADLARLRAEIRRSRCSDP